MNESLGSPTKRIFPASNLGVTQGFSGFTETRLVVSDPKWPHHHDHTSSSVPGEIENQLTHRYRKKYNRNTKHKKHNQQKSFEKKSPVW